MATEPAVLWINGGNKPSNLNRQLPDAMAYGLRKINNCYYLIKNGKVSVSFYVRMYASRYVATSRKTTGSIEVNFGIHVTSLCFYLAKVSIFSYLFTVAKHWYKFIPKPV